MVGEQKREEERESKGGGVKETSGGGKNEGAEVGKRRVREGESEGKRESYLVKGVWEGEQRSRYCDKQPGNRSAPQDTKEI